MMTKKDYQAFAAMLHDLRKHNASYDAEGFAIVRIIDVAGDMAEVFAKDNPRFDRRRFIKATE